MLDEIARVAAISALLLTMVPGARAESCSIPTDDEVAARTAKYLLSIDGKLLVDERCKFGVLPDGRETIFDAGKYYAEVSVTLDRRGSPTVVTAKWNRGNGRSDQMVSLGPVTGFDRRGAYFP
jgi:hypothetical protein